MHFNIKSFFPKALRAKGSRLVVWGSGGRGRGLPWGRSDLSLWTESSDGFKCSCTKLLAERRCLALGTKSSNKMQTQNEEERSGTGFLENVLGQVLRKSLLGRPGGSGTGFLEK